MRLEGIRGGEGESGCTGFGGFEGVAVCGGCVAGEDCFSGPCDGGEECAAA